MRNIVRIIIGTIFIVSGIAKLYPIEPFELTFIDLGIANFLTAPFFARFIIGLEFFLGLSIIFNAWMKQFIYYFTQAFLILLTSYLVFLGITEGYSVDCKCFGSWITLTPIESIIKNLILMGGLIFIRQRHPSHKHWWLPILFLTIAFILPFSLNKVGLHNMVGIEVNEKVDFSDLPSLYKTNKKIDFSTGKKVVAFFTWTCPHCINASRKFTSLNKHKKINNLYFIIGSKKEEGLLEFFKTTQSNFPTIWINDDTFFKYSGGRLPAIVYIENGVVKKKWFGDLFDVDEIMECLSN